MVVNYLIGECGCGEPSSRTNLGIVGEDGENWDPVEANATREPRDGVGRSLLGVFSGINRRE